MMLFSKWVIVFSFCLLSLYVKIYGAPSISSNVAFVQTNEQEVRVEPDSLPNEKILEINAQNLTVHSMESSAVHLTRDVIKYNTFRPKYSTELIELLKRKFVSDGTGRLLDLGCGSGQITFLLAPFYKKVIALDVDAKMIQEAKQKAAIQNTNNITWLHKSAEDISIESEGKYDLITIATAFHWMDREVVLKNAHALLKEEGGIAIFCAQSWWSSSIPWQTEIIALIQHYLGTNQSYYPPAWVHNSSHETLLHTTGFKNIQSCTVTTLHFWSLENIFGYLYSTAYCKPSLFGEKLEEFEKETASIFLKHHPQGECIEEFPFHVLIGYKS